MSSSSSNDVPTLTGLLENYGRVAQRTDDLIATLPDLDHAYPLPEAP